MSSGTQFKLPGQTGGRDCLFRDLASNPLTPAVAISWKKVSCLPNELRTPASAQSQAHLQSACEEEEVGSPGAPGGTAQRRQTAEFSC